MAKQLRPAAPPAATMKRSLNPEHPDRSCPHLEDVTWVHRIVWVSQ